MDWKKTKGLLLDLNGVFFSDDALLPGAKEVVRRLEKSGLPHLFVTNTTTMPRSALARRLEGLGLALPEERILSPAQAAVLWLQNNKKSSVHLVIDESLKSEFQQFRSDPSRPDAIVVGDIGDRWNFPIMNHLFELLMEGAELVALHKGRYWQKEGRLHIDIGAIVAGLEYASGKEATIIGKPAPAFFDTALKKLNLSAGAVAMIGDDLNSDVGGAQAAGMQGVLVRTGKFREKHLREGKIQPDAILENIGSLLETELF